MYKLIACVVILLALIQESVQDGNCPVCGAPTAEASITSTFAGSFSKTRRRRQATINPEPDSNAPKTRGNKFALAFMRNSFGRSDLTLHVTTEQDESTFTIETRFFGLMGFSETQPDSGLYSRIDTARRGEFTFIQLQSAADINGPPDLSVQSDGNDDVVDRQKGLILISDNPNDELTVYALSSNDSMVSADAFMAINCVEFPTARDYQYFIFSSDIFVGVLFESQFLITPCQDDTVVEVRPSQTFDHPSWVGPSSSTTSSQATSFYERQFNRFDTLMLSNVNDLTGTIVTSNKPLSVFSGHQCGTPTNDGTCDFLVEQIPPHPTYGDMFLLVPFNVRQSGEVYRIGTLSDGASLRINCVCEQGRAGSNNRVTLLSGSGRLLTGTINQGQYVECRTPQNNRTFCSVQSTRPVIVMSYTLGSLIDNLEIGDPSIVYIPPVDSYLTRYGLTSLSDHFSLYLSYTLQERDYELNTRGLLVNGSVSTPSDNFTTIKCNMICTEEPYSCGRGSTRSLGQVNSDLQFSGDVPFWGYVYGFARDVSFAYPLPFEMRPIGLARIESQDMTVVETVGQVDMKFMITGGDDLARSRAFAVTRNLSAMAGEDYTSTGSLSGRSNLRWRVRTSVPNAPFIVPIIDDDIPEPVEVLEIVVECEDNENCYLPRRTYTITIIDDQGQCDDLLQLTNGNIAYDFVGFPRRPYGSVATHTCNQGYYLSGDETRTCNNTEWLGKMPTCLEAFCFNLPEIADRNLEYDTKEDPFIGTRPNGTVATFTCMDGFILDGTTNTRICLNGGWTGTERVCLKAFCSDLPQVVNGDIMYNLTEDLLNATNLKQNGTVATYICPSRFRLDGNATRTCFNGDWTATAPVCIATFCSNLSQIDDGDLVYDNGGIIGFTLNDTKPNGTVASYSCNSGFSINTPDSTRICFDGDWTGTEPVCISNLAIDNNTLATFISVGLVGALVLLVITVGPCICACIYARLRRNKAERLRVSTIRMRKLSDRSNLMDYQMREIVKYVPESMRIPSSNLKLQDAVGQGAFGIVYKGLLMDWNNVAIRGVALKILKGLFSPSDVQSMVSEITKMQEFHHPHVMPLIGVCLDAGPGVSMVMPYMTNGSLLDYLKKERSALELAEGEDSEKVLAVRKLLLKMCHQIALGMAYLARHKFVHRDLAARNCMLDSNGDLKVGDFGLAEDVYGYGYFRQGDLEGVKLPYKWMAVESLNDAIFNEKTDVWSYGVTVWEVFSSGRTPYPGVDPMSLVALLREGKRLEPPQNTSCSTEMFSLMTSCWYEDSDERPSFDELAAELEKVLSTMVGYVELNMELVPITEDEHKYDHVHSAKEQKKLAEAVAEDVAMEENAAYRISVEDQLQAEQVATETNFAYGLRNEIQVTDHFNSDPPKHNHEGYSDYRDPTGYAKILHRRSSHETSV